MRVKQGDESKVQSRKWLVRFPLSNKICTTYSVSLLVLLMLILLSCAVVRSDSITKIALLAPFEGRYREIGYNALYAVRLAMQDSGAQSIHLIAVDDGGSIESAKDRMNALNLNPDIEAILVLGQFASHPTVQQVNDKSLIIIGNWGHGLADDNTLMASHPNITNQVISLQELTDVNLSKPTIGNDLFILEQVPDLYADLSQLDIISSGTLPDSAFTERYINSDLYVPDPNLLATLTVDVGRLVVEAIRTNTPIPEASYSGLNGEIHFIDGYWQEAPLHYYRYEDGALVARTD